MWESRRDRSPIGSSPAAIQPVYTALLPSSTHHRSLLNLSRAEASLLSRGGTKVAPHPAPLHRVHAQDSVEQEFPCRLSQLGWESPWSTFWCEKCGLSSRVTWPSFASDPVARSQKTSRSARSVCESSEYRLKSGEGGQSVSVSVELTALRSCSPKSAMSITTNLPHFHGDPQAPPYLFSPRIPSDAQLHETLVQSLSTSVAGPDCSIHSTELHASADCFCK